MAMPKASMDKQNDLTAGKYNIRAPRKIAPMQSKPVAQPMRQLSYRDFRLRLLAGNAAHYL